MLAWWRKPRADRPYREGKLADTAPKRPLALTIGAAAATLLIILGVLSGPAIVSCFSSADGMGQCLRGKMAEVGLVPPLPQTVVADSETPAGTETEADVALVEEAVTQEPELDVTPPVETADPVDPAVADSVVAATFGLLRAEPDGSVVIAGSGTPGTEVEIFANDELLGSADVETSGDWAFVSEEPLAPGGLEITLGEAGKTGRAAESFVVVIDEDRTTQPLVVASTPGEASEILQGLTAPTQIAAAPEEPAETPAPETAAAVANDTAAAADEVTEPVEAASTEAAVAQAPETPTDTAPVDIAALPEPAEPPADEPAEAEPQTDVEAPAATTSSEEATPSVEAANVEAASEPDAAATPDVEAATTTEAPAPEPQPEATPEPAVAALPPTIDAIEKDGDRTFFAGAGPEGGTVRLYVDDAFVADAPVEEGRWLVEAGPVLDQPSQRVRADLLAEGSSDVIARAEVDFVVEVPAEDPVAIAQADVPAAEPAEPTPQVAEPTTASAPSVPTQELAPQTPEPNPAPTPAAPAPEPSSAPAAPSASEPAPSEPAPEPVAPPAAEPQAPQTPSPVAQPAPAPSPPEATPPAAQPASPVPVTEQSAPVEPAVEAPESAEPAADEAAVPTMVAVSLGDPEAQRFASGKAIIRRGDNLWTIARRVYGEGLRYTTIYEANTGQIRDPDRIYPGQVFDLPTGTAPQ